MQKRLTIKIFGRVQGVGFRYGAKRQAEKLKLTGFVRNEAGGAVYLEAEGEPDVLEKLLTWCKSGPWLARVDKINFNYSDNLKGFTRFDVLW